jgi:long-chain acyl-CoA synthetase
MTDSGSVRGVHAIALEDPDRVALVCGDQRICFGELDQWANAIAATLSELGVAPGDKVATMMANCPDLFAAQIAIARCGALCVPMPWGLTEPEALYMLDDSQAKVVIHGGFQSGIRAAAALGIEALAQGDDGLMGRATELPRADYAESPVVTMGYTSGTTGRPKGIERKPPAPSRVAPPAPFAAFWGFQSGDVHLLCGPAYHTAPGAYAHMTLVEGGSVVIMERFQAAKALELIARERVTTTHMVPANFVRILQEDFKSFDLTSIKRVLHAAAPCPVPVKRAILEVFPPGSVWEYYGASEGMVSVISPEEWLAHPGSVGRPFPGIEVMVLDDSGQLLPPGEVGTIYVSAFPGAEFSYHRDPEKTSSAYKGRFFTVGDMGYLDEEGYLYLADRREDLIITGGVNVYPAEVEQAIIEDPEVVDVAVIGLPDEVLGQVVHAIVELVPGGDQNETELLARLEGRLARYKLPRSIEFVNELPREPNGKVKKSRLRAERLQLRGGQ